MLFSCWGYKADPSTKNTRTVGAKIGKDDNKRLQREELNYLKNTTKNVDVSSKGDWCVTESNILVKEYENPKFLAPPLLSSVAGSKK